jgi:hypothetical protein
MAARVLPLSRLPRLSGWGVDARIGGLVVVTASSFRRETLSEGEKAADQTDLP